VVEILAVDEQHTVLPLLADPAFVLLREVPLRSRVNVESERLYFPRVTNQLGVAQVPAQC
jgi:hypothetical protein